jgi:hypothetical protein
MRRPDQIVIDTPVLGRLRALALAYPDRRNPAVAASKAAADVSGFVQRLYHALELQAKHDP